MTFGLLLLLGGLAQSPEPEAALSLSLACGEFDGSVNLTLKNQADTDTAVLLGIVLANGRWYLPREVVIELKRHGTSDREELVFRGPANVAGRIEHWVVTLPTRSAFTLTLRADDFASTAAVPSTAAPEELTVRLTGKPITSDLNLDMPGMKSWRLWTGTAKSNTISLADCQK